jgi:fused signal recognition particle receptor
MRLFGKRDKQDASPSEKVEKLSRWRKGLNRTRAGFAGFLQLVATGEAELSESFYDELHDALVLADLGAALAEKTVSWLRTTAGERGVSSASAARNLLVQQLAEMLATQDAKPLVADGRLSVILFAGVNGTGKTTMLAKIAKLLQDEGYSVVAAAADTFRAAAVEQLSIWGKRVGFPVITGAQGADPASVVYNTIEHALAHGKRAVLIDTAGRMQTKSALMDELSKIGRAARKVVEKRGEDPAEKLHEVNLLVLDATTGQNAISQAKLFSEAIGLHGLVLNKIDGTAKGGVIFPVVATAHVPAMFLGVGEDVGDIVEFDSRSFATQLLELDSV